MTTEPPVKIKMLCTSKKYPFLKKNKVYQVPSNRADELFKGDEAESILPELDYEIPEIKGETAFITKQPNKQKENEEDKVKKVSLYLDETCMYEQIKKDNKFYFLKYDFMTSTITEHDCIEGEKLLFPIDDEEAQRDFVKLPSGICEYETEQKLIDMITKHVLKYLDVPEDHIKVAVLSIMKSWVFQRFHSINYLRVRGEPGTGKSRYLDVVGHLHYKVIATSGATTVAPIFRLINKWQGSLSIDEADLSNGDETNDWTKIINQGFEKDKPVMRCNTEDNSKIDFFDVYCPKVLSTRRQFKDVATETRCLSQNMTSTVRKDIPSSLNEEYYKETEILRNMLLLWRFRKYNSIMPDIGEKLDWTGIEPRLKQVNIGFIALFSDDVVYQQKFLEYIKTMQKEIRQERSITPEGLILQSILDLLITDRLITADGIITKANLTDDRGNKWKPQKLAPYMKTLGFNPAKKKRNGDVIEKVYYPEAEPLHNLFVKFIPEDDLIESYVELEAQCKHVMSNLSHTYYYLFVSLWPCVTSYIGRVVAGEQGKKSSKSKILGGHIITGHTETQGNTSTTKQEDKMCPVNEAEEQGNKMLNKLVQSGDLAEISPGTYKKVM